MPVTDLGGDLSGSGFGGASPFDAAWQTRIPQGWITFPDGSIGPPNRVPPYGGPNMSVSPNGWVAPRGPGLPVPVNQPGPPMNLPGASPPTPQGASQANAGSWNWPILSNIKNLLLGSPGEPTYLSPGGGAGSEGPRAGFGGPPAGFPRIPGMGGGALGVGLPTLLYSLLYPTPAETGELQPKFWPGGPSDGYDPLSSIAAGGGDTAAGGLVKGTGGGVVGGAHPGASWGAGAFTSPRPGQFPSAPTINMPARPTSTGRMPSAPTINMPARPTSTGQFPSAPTINMPARPTSTGAWPTPSREPPANLASPQGAAALLYALGGQNRAIGSARSPLNYDMWSR